MQYTEPLVSVLMTAYNREKYIAEAIDSVLASGYKNFELIICDDCSSDRTIDLARQYEAADSRVKVFVNKQNLGDYKNRNHAASLAKGKYIKYLDSDDTIYPWGLEAMVYCMEQFPEAGFGLMSYGLPRDAVYPLLVQPVEAFKYFYFRNALISMGPTGAIFLKSAFEAVNGFSGKPYVGDSEMWIKMGSKYPLVRMPLELIWWREHEGQQINEGRNNDYYLENQYSIYVEGLQNSACPLSEEEKRIALNNLQNVRIRNIISDYLLKFKIKRGLYLLKQSNIPVFDLWKAFRKNIYPA